MKFIFFLLLFHGSLLVSSQKLFKINSYFSVAVSPSRPLYNGIQVQNVVYDSVNKVLYIEDACYISLQLYPKETFGISYKIVDSVDQSKSYQSREQLTYSLLNVGSSTGYVSHNGIYLIKVKSKLIRTIFPKLVDLNKKIVKGTITSDFLTKNNITVMVTTSPNYALFSCDRNNYESFRLLRNGVTSNVYQDTLNASFNLQDGDKLVGVVDPKICGLLNGGYYCIRYDSDVLSDTLYVKNIVTALTNIENRKPEFIFGPNPTSDELFIGAISDIIVRDSMGKKVLEGKSVNMINMGNLSIGYYLVEVIVNGTSYKKLIMKI